jgi:diguanylate cyclase (GGDEF)-like protein
MLSFDQLAFYTVLYFLFDAPLSVLFGGWYAKMLAVLIYSLLFAIYLKLDQSTKWFNQTREIRDIFNDLTFRERYQALLAKAGVDSLTGVFNRGRFEADAPELIRECLGKGRALSMLIIDADHFKQINDHFGHQQGDAVLKNLAECLGSGARAGDHLSRFGGEEFVLLMCGTDHDDAIERAEQLRQDITRRVLRPDGRGLTVSIGVATGPEDGRTLDVLLGRADERLYHAKNGGRDSVHGRQGRFVADRLAG